MGIATKEVGQWAFDLGEHGGRLPAAQPVEHREGVGQRDDVCVDPQHLDGQTQ
jgi:hypothetical protein